VLWGYANLASHLPPDQPVYGIKSRGQTGQEEPATLREMAATYLKAVRQFQPHGPYYLGGYCFGGNVAYEMARQLEALGESVALLALLDSTPSNAGYETVLWWRPGFWRRFTVNTCYWLQDFAALESRDRRRFVGRKLRSLGRKLARRARRSPGPESVDIEEVIDPAHFPEKELKLWQIHLNALIHHVERSYSGPVTLLRTRGQALFCSLQEDFCWGRLAEGGVRVVFIPGSHENIFVEPNVDSLARELAAALTEVQSQTASHPAYDLA
jgi:thioesterase domain-containing protein